MLDTVGKALCHALRHFATVICPRYSTKELPREVNARTTRQRAQAKRGARASQNAGKTLKVKKFNMTTYKMHCIPDYPDAIRKNGTTDSYSTQTVSSVNYITDYVAQLCRVNSRIAFPRCGIGRPTRTVASLARSLRRRLARAFMLRWPSA